MRSDKVQEGDLLVRIHWVTSASSATKRNRRAAVPATIAFAGTSRVTTLPAPTSARSPIVTLARMVAPEPIEAPFFSCRLHSPVLLGLQRAVRVRGTRVGIVDEGDPVADEHVVLDRDAFADERVARNLTILADLGVLLDLDEGADLGVVAYLTTIEVDEPRQLDAFAKLHVGGDTDVLAHSVTALPLSLRD